MKRIICIVLLALSGGLMMVFAAGVDKCTEKSEACKITCKNQLAQCKARGSNDCDTRFSQCNADCEKDLKKCQEKAGTAPSAPKPQPTAKPKK